MSNVKILCTSESTFDIKNRQNMCVMGLAPQGHSGNRRKEKKLASPIEIKRIGFVPGSEKEAIMLFVDTNRKTLAKLGVYARNKRNFFPAILFYSYKHYLLYGSFPDEVPVMPNYVFKRYRCKEGGKFCEYMRKRIQPLLSDPESLFHDCEFLNKLVK